ncbi:MAG: tetratricopeptide repeat protein [Elusimicrobia bacterium]|nr:tetratricopeptide repeat protein [Elusimicrobiota bacterium]
MEPRRPDRSPRSVLAWSLLVLSASFFMIFPAGSPAWAETDAQVAFDLRAQGLAAQERGDLSTALFYFLRAVAITPNDPIIQNDVGSACDQLGQIEDAEKAYRKAIELDKDYLPAYANLGFLYSKLGRHDEAIYYLTQRVARGSPDDRWTLEAQQELERVYDRVPALKRARIQRQAEDLDMVIEEGKRRLEDKARREQAVGFDVAYQKGYEFLDARKYDEAVASFETAVLLDPRSAEARYALKKAKYDKEHAELTEEARMIRENQVRGSVNDVLYEMSGEPVPPAPVFKEKPALPASSSTGEAVLLPPVVVPEGQAARDQVLDQEMDRVLEVRATCDGKECSCGAVPAPEKKACPSKRPDQDASTGNGGYIYRRAE